MVGGYLSRSLASLALMGAAVAILLSPGGGVLRPASVAAVVFNVDITDDANNGACVEGGCSLRDAIIAANDAGGTHTIVLQPGLTYELSLGTDGDDEDNAQTGDLDITAGVNVTIEVAGGGTATVRQTIEDRVFHLVDPGASLTLNGITVTGGHSPVGGGGGILNLGTLVLTNSTVAGNTANTVGGGIASLNGTSTLTNSTVSQNTSGAGGGGIWIAGGNLTLTSSTVSGNNSGSGPGGGIWNDGGSMTLANSTVSGNTTSSITGGGGIHHSGTAETFTTLINSTVTANRAPEVGGIVASSNGIVRLQNTIVADQAQGVDCRVNAILDDVADIVSLGYNLDSDGTCLDDPQTGDLPNNANARLGPLQDNGGPTQTHALRFDSAAIDAANNAVCNAPPVNAVDQRAVARPQDGNNDGTADCDIGAYERGLRNLVVTKLCAGDGFSATFIITAADVTMPVGCDEDVIAPEVEPGTHTVSETITGTNAADFATAIACADGSSVMGNTLEVTVSSNSELDMSCVVINVFEPGAGGNGGAGGSLGDVLNDILVFSLDLEIDVDNTNNNAAGIDNDTDNTNDNDSTNELTNDNDNTNPNENNIANTQEQQNIQELNSENPVNIDIDSSPEVNIRTGD